MRRFALLLLLVPLLLAAVPARAGERYSFWVEKKDGMIDYTLRGGVVTDGSNYRVELEPVIEAGFFHPLLVSADGGAHESAFDPVARTYYDLKPDPSGVTFSELGLSLASERTEPSADGVQLTKETAGGLAEAPGGVYQARRHVLNLAYWVTMRLYGERIRGRVQVQATYWMAEDRQLGIPRLLRPSLVTAFPAVDRELAAALGALRGVPVYQEVTVRARIEGGEEQVVTVKRAIEKIAPAPTRPDLFKVPAGFRYEKPEISRPGLETPPFGQ